MVSGIYYGSIFGLASKLKYGRTHTAIIKKYTAKIVSGNIARATIAFTAFSAIFSATSCQLSRLVPDDELRPFIKGISGFTSTYAFAYYETRCRWAARYVFLGLVK